MKNPAAFRPFSERLHTPIAYNGQMFRSLTEARWAAFFDMIGQPYRYEAVGYPVNGGAQWCVPDFVLPEPGGRVHIVDVKGTLVATNKAHERRGWLCDLTQNRPSVARATMIFGPFPGPALKSPSSQVFSYVAGERDYTELFTTTGGLSRDKAARRARSVKLKRVVDVWPPPPPSASLPEADLPPGEFWLGPFSWNWLVAAFENAGMNGVLAGLYLWHLYNSQPPGGRTYGLGQVKFDELPVIPPARRKAMGALAKAGLISIQLNAGAPSDITLVPLDEGAAVRIRGPIPVPWILKAASFGRAGLMYGLALWRLAGKYNSATVRFWRDGAGICPNLVLDAARRAAQRKLAAAGLISVKRRGGAPEITILSAPIDVSGMKPTVSGGPLDKLGVEENEKEIALVEGGPKVPFDTRVSTRQEAA